MRLIASMVKNIRYQFVLLYTVRLRHKARRVALPRTFR